MATRTNKSNRTRAKRILAGIPWVLAFCACGTVDETGADLPRVPRLPDPVVYGVQVHPVLADSCATAGCHGRTGTFSLSPAADPMAPDADVKHPLQLEEPYRCGYYTVLGLCDLEVPEASHLLRWGSGDEPAHPGGRALSVADQAAVVQWLRTGGGSP